MGLLGLPAVAGLWHNTKVAERQRSGQSSARSSVGDVSLANDHQRRRRCPRREGLDVYRPYLVQQRGDISWPAAELLYDAGRQESEEAGKDRPEGNRVQPSVGAQQERGDAVSVTGSDLQGDHASPAMSDDDDLMRVSDFHRVEHGKGRFFQDHR